MNHRISLDSASGFGGKRYTLSMWSQFNLVLGKVCMTNIDFPSNGLFKNDKCEE